MNTSNGTKTPNSEDDMMCDDVDRETREIGGTTICAVIFITSTLGNASVVMVVYKERRMRTIVNLLIVNVAVSDFVYTLFVIPRVITETFTHRLAWLIGGSLGDALCKVVYFFQDVTLAVSLLSLLIIASERYYAIERPAIQNTYQKTRCILLIVISWLVACVIHSVDLYTFKLEEGTFCVHTWEPLFKDGFQASKIQFLVHTIIFVFIPFFVIAALYVTIFFRIRQMTVPEDASLSRRSLCLSRNRKVLRMLIALVIAFGVCWFPFLIYRYVATFTWFNKNLEPPCSVEFIGECTLYLTYINSSINPAIYFMFSKNYRYGLKNIMCSFFTPFFRRSRKRVSRNIETARLKPPPQDNGGVIQCEDIELQICSFPQREI